MHYCGRFLSIPVSARLQATIASVRKAFPALALLHPSRILLLARFSEFGDHPVEISDELWAEILPALMNVDVAIGEDVQQASGPPSIAMPISNIGM
jgi:hypothetical protein